MQHLATPEFAIAHSPRRRTHGRSFGRTEIIGAWDRAIAAHPDTCPKKPADYNPCRLSDSERYEEWFRGLSDAEQGRLAFPGDAEQQAEPVAIAEPEPLSLEDRVTRIEQILARQGYRL